MSKGKTPSDLPRRYRWAADELVALRLRNDDLLREVLDLRVELAKARGDDVFETVNKFMQVRR